MWSSVTLGPQHSILACRRSTLIMLLMYVANTPKIRYCSKVDVKVKSRLGGHVG